MAPSVTHRNSLPYRSLQSATVVFFSQYVVWKTDFPVEDTAFGYVQGWHRRFWQGSPDHRGVPGALGRVVTLIASADMKQFEAMDPHATKVAHTWGRIYKVPEAEIPKTLAQLDHREKVRLNMADTSSSVRHALPS
jgi:cation transport protein ChaC